MILKCDISVLTDDVEINYLKLHLQSGTISVELILRLKVTKITVHDEILVDV